MKTELFDYLEKKMKEDNDIYLLFVGLGYPRVDPFMKKFPGRAINTEASEQTALDIAVGLAYAGKKPVIYTITPFFLRAFETLRTYVNHENLPIILVGAGRDDDYSKDDGFSHDATDIKEILETLENIRQYYPNSIDELQGAINLALRGESPSFISIRR